MNTSIGPLLEKFERLPAESLKTLNIAASRLFAVGLLLLVFHYASILFWHVAYPEGFTTSFSPDIPKLPKVVSQARAWTWFRDTAVVLQKSVKQSSINAKLIGVIAQGDEEGKSVALIAVDGKPAQIFRVGDEVLPSIFLEKVGPYYIHLENDGVIEVVEIKKLNLFSKKKVEGEADPGQGNDPSAGSGGILDEVIQEPAKLAEIIQFKLTKAQGKPGFAIAPKSPKHEGTFSALGLLPGDVVVSADGKPVAELIKNPASWKSLLKSSGVGLQVIRDGVEMEVFVQ